MERSTHKRSHIRSIELIQLDSTRYFVVGSSSHGSEVCLFSVLCYELVVRYAFKPDGETDEPGNKCVELPIRSGQSLDETIRLCDEEVGQHLLCGVFVGAGRRAQRQISQLQAEEVSRGRRGDEQGLVVRRYADRSAGEFCAFI